MAQWGKAIPLGRRPGFDTSLINDILLYYYFLNPSPLLSSRLFPVPLILSKITKVQKP